LAADAMVAACDNWPVTVSLAVVEGSRPEALVAAAGQLGTRIIKLDQIIMAERNAVRELQRSWQGRASDAAMARAAKNLSQQSRLQEQLGQAQTVLQTGGTQLSQTRSALLGIVSALRNQGWQVSDNGVATPPPTLPEALRSTATAWTAIVQRLLKIFGDIDQQTAGRFPTFNGGSDDKQDGAEFAVGGGGSWGDDDPPEDAEETVRRALAGDTPAAGQVQQVLNSITPEHRAGEVPLSAEQGAYLSQMQAQQHGMSVDELTTAEQRLGDKGGSSQIPGS
jgi:uncharacterized protein YukE